MKKISLLGSTGSIGTSTLDVVERNPEDFQILAMSAGSNVELFAQQIRKFKPQVVALFDSKKVSLLKKRVADLNVEILDVKRAEDFSLWLQLGWCLHNIDDRLLKTWIKFSNSC